MTSHDSLTQQYNYIVYKNFQRRTSVVADRQTIFQDYFIKAENKWTRDREWSQ